MTRISKKMRWLMDHLHYDGDDCLVWPFAHDAKGRGRIKVDGKCHNASRHMCKMAHGEPPREGLCAAHSCGRGHMGCVNPKHLRWATLLENAADMVAHGTAQVGENNARAKLTRIQAEAIKLDERSHRIIAREYSVHKSLVGHIKQGRAWA
jgi:hypothetical protein